MHQAKKGSQRHFGMKSRVGVDADSGLVHVAVNTAASVGSFTRTGELMRDDKVAYGDSGCMGAGKRPEIAGGARKSAAAFRIGRKGTVKAKRGKAVETWKPGGRLQGGLQGAQEERRPPLRPVRLRQHPQCARAGRLGRCHA